MADETSLTDADEEEDVDTEAAPSLVTFTRVVLNDVSIEPAILTDLAQIQLPPVTLLDEALPIRMLSNGLSVGLLNWLASLVVRTLASTSIDTVGITLDGGVDLLAGTIQRALDLVELTNQHTQLPGSSVLGGATIAARRLVRALRRTTHHLVGGVTGSAKEVLGARATPVEVLRGVERAVGVLQLGLARGASSLLEGVANSTASIVEGVETTLHNRATAHVPVLSDVFDAAVFHVARATTGGVHALADGTMSVAAGVIQGSAAAIGGTAGGLSEVVGGISDGTMHLVGSVADGGGRLTQAAMVGDLEGVIDGAGKLFGGLGKGTERIVGGTFGGVAYFGKGVITGVEHVASGVIDPTERVAKGLLKLFPQEKSCVGKPVYQRTLLSRLGLRRRKGGRGRRRQATVCTTKTTAPSVST